MSSQQPGSDIPLQKDNLPAVAAALITGSYNPSAQRKIGVEIELPFFFKSSLKPLLFDGKTSITTIFDLLCKTGRWSPNEIENGNLTSLTGKNGGVSLEPGGQIEFSTQARSELSEIAADIDVFYKDCKDACEKLDIDVVPLGFHPHISVDECPYIWQRSRFKAQKPWVEAEGSYAAWSQSCSVQVTLDPPEGGKVFSALRLALMLQPVVASLFANSPFCEGVDTGYKSCRQQKFKSIDSPLFEVPDALFEKGYTMDNWVAHVLGAPMIVIVRGGAYIPVSAKPFQDMVGTPLPELAHLPEQEQYLTERDLLDHLTNVKPEVLLKRNLLLEFRAADLGPSPAHWMALTAFWTGIFYDKEAFAAAEEYVAEWTKEDRALLRKSISRNGLKAVIRGKTVQAVLLDLIRISAQGLLRTQPESVSALQTIIEQTTLGLAPADVILDKYRKNGNNLEATLRQSFLFFPESEEAGHALLAKAV